MRTRRLLGVLALVGAAMLALSAIPITQPVLSLRPSGDPADREDISAGRTALQRVTLDSGATLTGLEVLPRDPVPRDAELTVTVTARDQKRETRTTLSSATEPRVRIDIDALPVQSGAAVEIRIGIRGTPQTTLSLATATGVPAGFAGALTIGAHERDRHLALTLFTRTTAGSIGLQRLARLRATGVFPDAAMLSRTVIGAALGIAAAALLQTGLVQRHFWLTLGLLAVVFVALHAPFRSAYPATNDEGSILMDAQRLRAGDWPGGAKGPLAVALLGGMLSVTGPSLLAARGFVAVLGAVTVVLIGALGRRLWDTKAGLPAEASAKVGVIAAALAATLPAVHAQSAQVFLQSFSLPFVLGALVVLLSLQQKKPSLGSAVAGALLALAALARQTSLAFLPISLALIAIDERRDTRSLARSGTACVGGFILIILLAAGTVLPLFGREKTLDFLGWQGAVVAQQRAEQLVTPAREGTTETPLLQIIRNGWPVILGGAPLLVLCIVYLLKAAGDLARVPAPLSAAVSALAMFVLVSAGSAQLTVPGVPAFAPLALGATLVTVIGLLVALPRLPRIARPGRDLVLLAGSWIALTVGYAQYGRFRLHYHAEFLPLYLLAGAALLGTMVVSRPKEPSSFPRWPIPLSLAGVGAFISLAYPVVLARHHAGNIPLPVVSAVVEDLQRRTAPGEEIFTAQVLFPVLADRPVPFRISHPGWYREEMFGAVPTELRRRYYPDRDVLRAYLQERPVRVAVVERRTREVFLEFDPQLKELLQSHYERVRVIENPLLDPIEIWKWKER